MAAQVHGKGVKMLTVGELLKNVEMQGDFTLCYYNYDKYERIEVPESEEIYDKMIKYMYPENNTIYIEFDNE